MSASCKINARQTITLDAGAAAPARSVALPASIHVLASTAVLLSMTLLGVAPASGKEGAAPNWFTGQAFSQQLEQSTNIACSDRPLATVVRNLAEAQRVAMWLDRRVDPERPLSLAIRGESLKAVIDQIAAREQLGASALGSVVYFGPPEAAAKLRTLAYLRGEELKSLAPPRRKELTESRPWHWADLATPRELIASLAREGHVEIQSLERIPHDLWPARICRPRPGSTG